MLFEQYVNGSPSKLISLSEARRDTSIEGQEIYIQKLDNLLENKFTLSKPILFSWHDRNSSCWRFEQMRARYELAEKYIQNSKEHFDKNEYKEAKQLLERSLTLQFQTLNINNEWTFRDSSIRGMPELNNRYLLARIFRTKSFYYYTLFSFKTNEAAIKRAYQLGELSNQIWKTTADINYTNKLVCLWYHTMASNSEDFGKKISYSTKANELDDPAIKADHERWEEQNNTVYFNKVEEVDGPQLITVREGLEYL